jgi:hypothetical protein
MEINIEDIAKVNLDKDDILVVTLSQHVPVVRKREIERRLVDLVKRRVLLLDAGTKLSVLTTQDIELLANKDCTSEEN